MDQPGHDVPSIDRIQDAIHEMIAHQRAGVARDIGRNARNAQVAHDAAEGMFADASARRARRDRMCVGPDRFAAGAMAMADSSTRARRRGAATA